MAKRGTSALYQSRAKDLKSIGMVPNYDLRKNLSESQKRYIRKLWREYHEIATAPDRFFIRDVSIETGNLAKSNGVAAHHSKGHKKSKIYVPKDNYNTVKISDNKITLRVKEKHADKQRQILLTPMRQFLDRLQYLSEHKKLHAYEFLQVRIGNNQPFHSSFSSYDELLNYVSGWQPKDIHTTKDALIMQMSIVKYTDFGMILGYEDDSEYSGREYAKPKRQRKSIKGKRTSRGR